MWACSRPELLHFVMGAGRGMAGVGVNSSLMDVVPKHPSWDVPKT